MSNQGTPDSTPRKSEQIEIIGEKNSDSLDTAPLMLDPPSESSGAFDDSTEKPNKYNEEQSQKELKEIMKKSGLLDKPSNMLPVGIKEFESRKKMENLMNIFEQKKLKEAKMSKIQEEAELEFKKTYDFLKENEDFEDLPLEKITEIATFMMNSKYREKMEEVYVLFPNII
eukprot:gene12999-7735_t